MIDNNQKREIKKVNELIDEIQTIMWKLSDPLVEDNPELYLFFQDISGDAGEIKHKLLEILE